ncbi:MAG: PAS domain S-box protein [Methanoregulaceae archaeon]|nr:PAS domain S-box protein [Methanoregulaceae archaeon]
MEGKTIQDNPGSMLKPGILLAFTVVAVVLTIFCLSSGITIVYTHFFYIPIILAAYWYRKRGVFYAVCLSAFYLGAVYLLVQPDLSEAVASVTRAAVFIGISIFIAYLSLIIQREHADIQRSETKFREIWEHVEAGIVLVDRKTHRIVDANPMALRLTGYSREEMIGHLCHTFICPAAEGRCPIDDLGQSIEHAERDLLNREGEKIPILKTVTPMNINGDEYLVENFVSISAVKDAENALIAYIREAALRIKNPLELVTQNISDIKNQVSEGETEKAHIIMELAIQQKHIEEILATIHDLNVAVSEKRTEIPDAMREFLEQ